MSPKPYDTVWEYLRDVAITVLLIVGGSLLAGVITAPFQDTTDLAYPAALCVGLAPVWWFTRRCEIHEFDFHDYGAVCVFTLLAAALSSALAGAIPRAVENLVIGIAFGGYATAWIWMRGRFAARSRTDTTQVRQSRDEPF